MNPNISGDQFQQAVQRDAQFRPDELEARRSALFEEPQEDFNPEIVREPYGVHGGVPDQPLYRTMFFDRRDNDDVAGYLRDATQQGAGMHWSNNRLDEFEFNTGMYAQGREDIAQVALEVEHPGSEHLMDPTNPDELRTLKKEIWGYENDEEEWIPEEAGVSEVPIRSHAPLQIRALHTKDSNVSSGTWTRHPVQGGGVRRRA